MKYIATSDTNCLPNLRNVTIKDLDTPNPDLHLTYQVRATHASGLYEQLSNSVKIAINLYTFGKSFMRMVNPMHTVSSGVRTSTRGHGGHYRAKSAHMSRDLYTNSTTVSLNIRTYTQIFFSHYSTFNNRKIQLQHYMPYTYHIA